MAVNAKATTRDTQPAAARAHIYFLGGGAGGGGGFRCGGGEGAMERPS